MAIENSRYISLIIILLLIYAFFGYFLANLFIYVIMLVSAVGLLFYLFFSKSILINEQIIYSLLVLSIIFWQILSITVSAFPEDTVKVVFFRITILVIGMLIVVQGKWYGKSLKLILFFSIIHVFFTLFAFISPNQFLNIVTPIFPNEIVSEISRFMLNSVSTYPGITDSTGQNAYYISVAIAMIYSFAFFKDKEKNFSKLGIASLIFCFVALLLTGKRGHLLASLLSIILVSSTVAKIKGKKIILKLIVILSAFLGLFAIIIRFFPNVAITLSRFMEKFGGDQTSGRLELYELAINQFMENPLMGIGSGAYSNMYGIENHNLILQLLSENGVIGLLLFIIFIVFNFKITINALKISQGNKEYNYLIFSLYFQLFFLIYSMTGNTLNDGFIFIIYCIVTSIPVIVLKYKKQIKSKDQSNSFLKGD